MGFYEVQISTVRAMCGVHPKDIKGSMDLMLILVFGEAEDQLAMANGVCWYGMVTC